MSVTNERAIEIFEQLRENAEEVEFRQALSLAIDCLKPNYCLAQSFMCLKNQLPNLKFQMDKDEAEFLIQDLIDIYSWKNNNRELEDKLKGE